MEEKKFVEFKKEELGTKEYIMRVLGKGRISNVSIEYTPVGEKIIIGTSKPGLIIGRRGEKIEKLTSILKRRFNLDNPHIEIREITESLLNAQLVSDEIALLLERKGSLKFKVIAYRMLKEIMNAGALGTELVLAGKLPSDRSRTWRFTQGYLKKTGDPAKVVDTAQSQAKTKSGVVGITVKILPPDAHIHDKIDINEEIMEKIKLNPKDLEDLGNKGKKDEVKKKIKKKTKPSEKEE